jgi:hypothetical protein
LKKLFVLAVFTLLTAFFASAQDITGDWNGTLNTGEGSLRLVLHLARNTDGTLKATLDSIDQGVNGIPVTSATLSNSQLTLKVDAVHGTYDGKVNRETSEIEGTWNQGAPLPLTFRRGGTNKEPTPRSANLSDIYGD